MQELAKREGKVVESLAAEILQEALAAREKTRTWVDEVSGSFENDPEFEEVVRLGKELRRAERTDR
ncbi:MAG: hypothetical protein HY721_24060 [Planctomycetes bacterium]|nr:hypothetical protein [Planctomycetota bacterium]